jgi:hypothetical protein
VGNAGAAGTRGEKAARTRIKALGESAIIPSSPASVMTQTCTPDRKAADRHNNVASTETCECDGLPLLQSARAPIKQAQHDNKRRKSAEHKRRRSQSRATFPLASVRSNQNLHARKVRLQENQPRRKHGNMQALELTIHGMMRAAAAMKLLRPAIPKICSKTPTPKAKGAAAKAANYHNKRL